MIKNHILVTTYSNPDLDGIACAVAYAEFLQKKNQNAEAAFFGILHQEAYFVLRTFAMPQPEDAEKILLKNPNIILVDASNIRGIAHKINPLKVIEIIDHRKINQSTSFLNAKVQIELVGSAATLVAEKFFYQNVVISMASAALLYSAIISNTANFQANVTTDRDKKMAQWLLTFFSLPKNYVHDMFAAKSVFKESLIDTISNDFATLVFNGTKIGIGQLEIVNVENFVNSQLENIRTILKTIKTEKELDIIFLSIIDLEKAKNTFLAIDEPTKTLLECNLGVVFNKNIAEKEGIMMRKTIVPLLSDNFQK